MHLPANILFVLGLKVTQNIALYPLHHVAYAPAKFKVATPDGSEEMHLQIKHYLTFVLELVVNVTKNVAQYPLFHVTYAASKFQIETANGFGYTITRNVTGGRTCTHGRTGVLYGIDNMWLVANSLHDKTLATPLHLPRKSLILGALRNKSHLDTLDPLKNNHLSTLSFARTDGRTFSYR